MRILFENEIIAATLSATNANVNYPINNIKHDFLTIPFKATGVTSVVTFTFASAKTIDCCYIGFTNATSAVLRLYNSSDTLLATQTISVTRGGGVFTSQAGVSYGTVTLTGSETLYLGAIAVGNSYTMPNPVEGIIPDKVDNSKTYDSDNGQHSVNKVEWLKKLTLDFFTFTIDDYNEIKALCADVVRPIWVDVYENTTNMINPIYGKIEFSADKKENRLYYFSIDIKECR